MKNLRQVFVIFILVWGSFSLSAQGFISVKELVDTKKKENYMIIDARSKRSYNTSHVKGAINLPVTELAEDDPYEGKLLPVEKLSEILGDKGISEDKNIVVYCNRGNAGGRLYWVLNYMGAENVKMLDGNIGAWEKAGEPMSGKSTRNKHKKVFLASLNEDMIATHEEVESAYNTQNARVLDVRSIEYYNGTDEESEGHIRGAISFPADDLKDDHGYIKTNGELLFMMDSLDIAPEMEVILYGQNGIKAGLVYNVLTTNLDYKKVKVYEGSYTEWIMIHPEDIEK